MAPQNANTKPGGMPTTSATRPHTMAATPTAMTELRSIVGLQDCGGAVSHDLAHVLADLRGVETHHDDGVRSHRGRVAHQPVHRLPASLFQELGVFVDLPAGDGAQAREDVAAQPARTHHHAEHLAQRLLHPLPRHALRCRHQHAHLLRWSAVCASWGRRCNLGGTAYTPNRKAGEASRWCSRPTGSV